MKVGRPYRGPPNYSKRFTLTQMHRGAVITIVLAISAGGCGDGDVSGPTSTSVVEIATTTSTQVTTSPEPTTTSSTPTTIGTPATTTVASLEVTVIGVVVAVDGTLAGTNSLTIRLEDGSDLTLVPADGLLFDGVSPLSQVRGHLVSGSPVQITYRTSAEGPVTAVEIGDAGGGEHSHDD